MPSPHRSCALIYLRISKNRTGEHASIERQREECLRLAQQHGHERVEEFVDESRSAYKSTPRPAFEQLIERVDQQRTLVIVVWHIDRLYRQPRELEQLLQLAETRQIRIDAVHGGTLDLVTHEGRMFARYLVSFAHYESAHKAARVARAYQQRARQGLWHGAAAYGYCAGGQMDPPAAEVVRGVVVDYLAGCSFAEIARRLTACGTPTPARSTAWHATTVRSILASDRLHRIRTTAGGRVVSGVWESIITPEDSELVRTLLILPQRRTARSSLSLLGGMATCAECGNTLSIGSGGSGSRIRRYICLRSGGLGCGNGIAADGLDRHVMQYIESLTDLPTAASEPQADVASLSARAATLVDTSRELLRDYGAGRIGREQHTRMRAAVNDGLSQLLDEVDAHLAVPRLPPGGDATTVDRRNIIHARISDVSVRRPSQRRRFDPERIVVVPRTHYDRGQLRATQFLVR